MHALLTILAATTSTTAKATKSKGSSSYTLIFIVVIFGAVYLLFIRPRQQKLRQQQTATRQLSVGDQVLTAGGIHGRVVALDADVAEVEVAPGVVLTFLRRAVNPRPDAAAAPSEPEPADDDWPMERGHALSSGEDEPPGDQPSSDQPSGDKPGGKPPGDKPEPPHP